MSGEVGKAAQGKGSHDEVFPMTAQSLADGSLPLFPHGHLSSGSWCTIAHVRYALLRRPPKRVQCKGH